MDKERAFDTPDVRYKGKQGPPSPAESMKEALNAIKRYDVISDMGKMQDSLLRIIEEQVRLRMQQQVETNVSREEETEMGADKSESRKCDGLRVDGWISDQRVSDPEGRALL